MYSWLGQIASAGVLIWVKGSDVYIHIKVLGH